MGFVKKHATAVATTLMSIGVILGMCSAYYSVWLAVPAIVLTILAWVVAAKY